MKVVQPFRSSKDIRRKFVIKTLQEIQEAKEANDLEVIAYLASLLSTAEVNRHLGKEVPLRHYLSSLGIFSLVEKKKKTQEEIRTERNRLIGGLGAARR